MGTENPRQLTIALVIYLTFTPLIGVANMLNSVGERDGTLETLESIGGLLMRFVAFPVFCIGLPCGWRGGDRHCLAGAGRWSVGLAAGEVGPQSRSTSLCSLLGDAVDAGGTPAAIYGEEGASLSLFVRTVVNEALDC
jgi:hypothetical protein